MKSLFCILTVFLFSLTVFSPAASQSGEHPEHPSGGQQEEHPAEHQEHPAEHQEHPSEHPEHPTHAKKPVTIESVAVFLEDHVEHHSSGKGGWFEVRDEKKNKNLKLKLDKIHRERLAKTDEGTYFVCADFTAEGGKVYDLDFWVKETDEGLEVTETMVHKEAGKPRYQWMEKDGVWSRKPLSEGK